MAKRLAWLAILPVVLGATGAVADDADAIALGHDLLQENCAACHAIGPADTSPHLGAPPFRTLHERYDVQDLEEGLVEGLVSGHPDMPEFVFDPEQAAAIIAYLKSLE